MEKVFISGVYFLVQKKKNVGNENETLGFVFSGHPMIQPKSVNKQWFVYFHIENYMLSNICRSETLQQVNAAYLLNTNELCFRAMDSNVQLQ